MRDVNVLVNRRRVLAAGTGLAGAAVFAGGMFEAAAASKPADESAPDPSSGEGWIQLFDGKTLEGWHKNPQKIVHGTGGVWEVEEGGVLAGHQDPPGSGNGGILLTDRKFRDFELSLELKPDWGIDSGVFLRANDRGQCIQMTVDYYDEGNIGHLYGEETGAWVARAFSIQGELQDGKLAKLKAIHERDPGLAGLARSCSADEWLKAWKVGEWNRCSIRVTGEYPRVTTWINGLLVCDFDGGQSNAEQYDREQLRRLLGREGSIAVQVHGGSRWPREAKCRWRNIWARPLRA